MIELRPYQREAVAAVHGSLADGKSAPAVGLPTGTGKTIVFSQVAEERAQHGRSLILAHRDELLQQAADKYREINPNVDIGFVQAGRNDIDHAVVVASVQSLAQQRRLDVFPWQEFTTLVIDEAHHAVAPTYRKIIDRRREDSLLLGVSATLERGDKVGLGAVWDGVVYLKTLQEMILAGYLVDIRARSVKLNFNMGLLKTSRGDFQAGDVGEMLTATGAYSVAARAYLEHATGRKAIIFTPTIAAAHLMAATFQAAGITAEAVDGQMPIEERRAIIARLRSGETMVVANAMVLTEGFDEPSVDCIIVARPTKSRPLYVQMVGRGTRLYPGKEDLIVLDLVGNTDRVDLQTLPRLFGLRPGDVEKDGAARAAANAPAARAAARAGLYDPNAGLVTAEVNLFERKDINWLRLADGRWILSIGDHGDLVLEPAGSKWQAVVVRPRRGSERPREILGENLDIGYAMGVAEEHLRTEAKDAMALTNKQAPWRKAKPTEKQIAILQRNGIPVTDTLTKGEASDLISGIFARDKVGA